jgi:predicted TIM-barrel fold metal-dependent hydrolase
MLVVDAHNHAAWLGVGIDEHVRNMDAHGIGVTWLLTWDAPEDEIPPYYADILTSRSAGLPLSDAVEAARRYPGRFIVGYCPDPRCPDALGRLQDAIERHGVRTCGEWKLRMEFDDPANLPLLRFCAERGLPVTVHLTYRREDPRRPEAAEYWYGGSVEALEHALKAVPGLTLIGHGPGFWANISGDAKHLTDHNPTGPVAPGGAVVRLMREWPNLHADLSGRSGSNALSRDPAFGRRFALEFADRLLFARDAFDDACRRTLDALDLPPEPRVRIMGENAARLVPLT